MMNWISICSELVHHLRKIKTICWRSVKENRLRITKNKQQMSTMLQIINILEYQKNNLCCIKTVIFATCDVSITKSFDQTIVKLIHNNSITWCKLLTNHYYLILVTYYINISIYIGHIFKIIKITCIFTTIKVPVCLFYTKRLNNQYLPK